MHKSSSFTWLDLSYSSILFSYLNVTELEKKTEGPGCFPYVLGYIGALLLLFLLAGFPNIFKSIALYFSNNVVEGTLIEHYCPGDNVYIYNFHLGNATYKGSYDGYLSAIEDKIGENAGCEGTLKIPVNMDIKFVKAAPGWNEPVGMPSVSILSVFISIAVFLTIVILAGNALAKEFM